MLKTGGKNGVKFKGSHLLIVWRTKKILEPIQWGCNKINCNLIVRQEIKLFLSLNEKNKK